MDGFEKKELYEIIIIPLIICGVTAVVSLTGAIVSFRSAKKIEKFKLNEKTLQESAKMQHDLVIAPLYHTATSEKPFSIIIEMNNAIVNKHKNILSTKFLAIYESIKDKSLNVYKKTIEFYYNASIEQMQYNLYDKKTLKKAKRYISREQRREMKEKKRELYGGKHPVVNGLQSIFQLIWDVITFLSTNIIENILSASMNSIIVSVNAVDNIANTINKLTEVLVVQKDVPPEKIDEIINEYEQSKATESSTEITTSKLINYISFIESSKRDDLYTQYQDFAKRVTARLSTVDESAIIEPDMYIASNILDNVRYEDNTIKSIFADLLASSMGSGNGIHPSFVEIVKMLSPFDAHILINGTKAINGELRLRAPKSLCKSE